MDGLGLGELILIVIQCLSRCWIFILYNSICYDTILGFRLRYEIFNEIEITAAIDFGKYHAPTAGFDEYRLTPIYCIWGNAILGL